MISPTCPKCHFDGIATPPANQPPPIAGEFTVCYRCGQIVQFEGEAAGTVRLVADAELLSLPVVIRQQLRRMRQIARDRIERVN